MKSVYLFFAATFLLSCTSQNQNDWHSIFDGQTLQGWQAAENETSFRVEDSAIICEGPRAHLFYTGVVNNADYKNFEFKADVMTTPGANSGVYFHTVYQEEDWPSKGYEVQVNNTHKGTDDYVELKKTGSLYAIRNIFTQFVEDHEWFNLHFIVKGNRVKIFVNGLQTVDYVQPENPHRTEDYAGRLLSNGTFAIQCHDPESKVSYKNIMVKPLPDDAVFEDERPVYEKTYKEKIADLHMIGFPLIDYHVHIKDDMTLDSALQMMRYTGINYGIAVNCGLDFTINTNEKLKAYIDENLEARPVFKAMQAEGREWVDIFSEEAINKFDYVFTDAMTYTEADGNRVHLWKPEEVHIDDKQQFMDMYVGHIVNIINDEPIDIYVNATYLPEVIADEYDELWTTERMDKVIEALANNEVAFEISARYKIPNLEFIQRAKEKGVKFAFGTNNSGMEELQTKLDYCFDIMDKADLTTDDMFMPDM